MATLRIGKVRPSPKGAYDVNLTYSAFDLVNWKGNSYLALKDVPIGQEPDLAPTYWQLYAERGTDGQDGATGPQGPEGPQGPQGAKGDTGPRPSHEWGDGSTNPSTSIRFQNADGSWGTYVDILGPVGPTGPQGPEGPRGPRPGHEWSGTSLRFEQSDGTWGAYVDLQGPQGPEGPQGPQGDPPPASELLSTLKSVDGSGSGLDADLLDGLQASAFLRSNAASVTSNTLGARFGVHGDYAGGAGTGTNWGANIWAMGPAYDGSSSGTAYTLGNYYGINWLRAGHGNADAEVGEGLYIWQAGVRQAGIGTAGIATIGAVRAEGDVVTQGSVTAAGDVTAFSDQRVKVNVKPMQKALTKLQKLTGVTYDRTDIKTDRQAGLIAQDVQKVLPEAVREVVVDGHGETRLTLNYNAVVGLLVQSVKELTNRVIELEKANGSAE